MIMILTGTLRFLTSVVSGAISTVSVTKHARCPEHTTILMSRYIVRLLYPRAVKIKLSNLAALSMGLGVIELAVG